MSDTFDHELEAFERWENGECDVPDFIEDKNRLNESEDEHADNDANSDDT